MPLDLTPEKPPYYDQTEFGPTNPQIKQYTALLTQTSTSAPTAIVLQNTTQRTITWTRTDVGDYTGTISPIIDMNKTAVTCNGGLLAAWNFNIRIVDTSTIQIQTAISGSLNDGALLKTQVQLTIYN